MQLTASLPLTTVRFHPLCCVVKGNSVDPGTRVKQLWATANPGPTGGSLLAITAESRDPLYDILSTLCCQFLQSSIMHDSVVSALTLNSVRSRNALDMAKRPCGSVPSYVREPACSFHLSRIRETVDGLQTDSRRYDQSPRCTLGQRRER